MLIRRRAVLLSLVIGLVVTVDQLTKVATRVYLAPRPPIALMGGIVRFAHSENVGAFLGLGAAFPPAVRFLVFGVLSGALLLGVTAYVFTDRGLTRRDVVAASLIIGGGLGNLIDRALRSGRVTDFVSIGIGPLRTGIFNVADVAIVVGVGWFLVSLALGVPGPSRPDDGG